MIDLSGVPPNWDKALLGASRFVVLAAFNNDAVRDNNTGLVWETSPQTTAATWNSARFACINKDVGRQKGWRVPAIPELASLIDPSVAPPGPTLPPGHPFPNVQSAPYWSATAFAESPTDAWHVHFLGQRLAAAEPRTGDGDHPGQLAANLFRGSSRARFGLEDGDSHQFASVVVVDKAAFHVTVRRTLGLSQADIQHVRFLIIVEPEMFGPQVQRLRHQAEDVYDFRHWRPLLTSLSVFDVMNAVTTNPSLSCSRYATTTCFGPMAVWSYRFSASNSPLTPATT